VTDADVVFVFLASAGDQELSLSEEL